MTFAKSQQNLLTAEDLNILDKNILRIALTLRKKRRNFDMTDLLEKCCSELPNPGSEILKAIREIYQKKYIVPGKQLFKTDILQNENRNAINNYILRNPGVHERDIRDTLNLGANEAFIHLSYLVTFGFLRKKSYKNKTVYFPIEFSETQELEVLLLRDETNKKIYDSICVRDKIRLSEIAETLNIPYTTIQYHLNELVNNGLLKKIQENQISFYAVTVAPIQKETVEVRRDYDYVGGKIRFKAAVRNFTKMTINNIGVNLNPSEQFIVDNPQQIIANLPPNTTRGVDFYLTPLACGQSVVFGSISYQDAFGKVNTLTIEPKEISIKCPLVMPQTATQAEVDEWMKNLKKGTSAINYHSISDAEAFRIGQEQVSALDLNETKVDHSGMMGLYSGRVKVTGKEMVIRLSIQTPNIILDVWTDDIKQTTGFLAYITNLINMKLEVCYKMVERTKEVTQKITNLLKICGNVDEFFEVCKKLPPVLEVTTRLKNIYQLCSETVPESVLIQALKVWNTKLTSVYDSNQPLDSSVSINLQYETINWLNKIHELLQSHMKIYQETFDDLSQLSGDFALGSDALKGRIIEHMKSYGLEILSYILILDKGSGLTIFEKNLGDLKINPDLIGGFIHALQSFGLELSHKETSMKTLSYESYQFQIETGEFIRAALIVRGTPNQFLTTKLTEFVQEFERAFREKLAHFSGNVSEFQPATQLFDTIFH